MGIGEGKVGSEAGRRKKWESGEGGCGERECRQEGIQGKEGEGRKCQ